MRKIVISLSEDQLVPLDEHPAAAFSCSFDVNPPAVDYSVLIIPLPARLIVEVKTHIDTIVLLHHFAEGSLCDLTD